MIRINIEFDECDTFNGGGAKKAVDALVDFCKRVTAASGWPGVNATSGTYTVGSKVLAQHQSMVELKEPAKPKRVRKAAKS